MKKAILIIDDNPNILTSLRFLLSDRFKTVCTLSSPQGAVAQLRREPADVVLLDMNFSAGINSGNEGLFWLGEIKAAFPTLPVVLFTAYADISLAVEGLKRGAADFVVKPWDNAKLIQTLEDACTSVRRKKKEPQSATMYWGHSEAMLRLRTMVERCSRSDANLLITGENGTGKDVLAREIHRLSARADGPMITVDMGAVTDTLFESELFGHVKGAFTDAQQDRKGRFEAAHGGTLFLDEIGNLSMPLQAKLLTAIQRQQVVRVGSNKPVDVDIRLICATNKDLEAMVTHGTFREDLLWRINTIPLHLPPLRERREDIRPLAELFLRRYATEYNRTMEGFSSGAITVLERHPWYGNIRELQHTIERAVIMADSPILRPEDLTLSRRERETEVTDAPQSLEDMEREAVRRAVEQCKGNFSQAAAQLGISRQTLYNKMKRYGL